MKNCIYLVVLLWVPKVNSGGLIFEPPVIIEPLNSIVGDIIRVGLFKDNYPPCLSLPQNNLFGDSHSVVMSDNQIELTVVTETAPICIPAPISPAPREYYEIGSLPEGTYSLDTFYVDIFTAVPPDGVNPFVYGPTIRFSVTAAPQPVPVLSGVSLFTLTVLILFLFRKIKGLNKHHE